ncbi:MAG: hypothetical protein JJ831_08090 [Prochlorococcus marinus XMU1422]|nr:hypothetical protein [Prochlorococcus marinus XMU1421]MBO7013260.1 hypothetical protein [Prochlorococcus marinus XMU1422]MCR8542285.1 hypothetical protein [Prochlorococcus marinus XMU1423]
MNSNFSTFILFLIFNISSIWLIIPFLRRRLIDKPNFRSAHKKPIPRGGGIVFIFYSLIYSIYHGSYEVLIFIPIIITSLLDDLYQISRRSRYIVHLFTSIAIIIHSKIIDRFFLNFFGTFLLIIFLVIFITAIINFINFMDGIDGLVGGYAIVFLISAGLLESEFNIALISGLLGFLFYNWFPAKIFMGDIGSTFLGAYFSYTLINSDNIINFINLFLILSPLLLDAFTCVIRRFIKGENIFKAHSLHLYQRLYQSGMKQSSVALIYISSSILINLVNILFGLKFAFLILVVIISYGIYLDRYKAESFNKF